MLFQFIGMVTCIVGAFALLGLAAWQGVEWWVRFNQIRGPLIQFYAAKLQREAEEKKKA